MSEWTVEIMTHPGMAGDEDSVASIHDLLSADARAFGPALSWDLDTHAVSVSFQVEAEGFMAAVIRAAGAMTDAVGGPDHVADFRIQPRGVRVGERARGTRHEPRDRAAPRN